MNIFYQLAKQSVTGLAKENFSLYPENYPIQNGMATNEASENVSDLAKAYWDNRTELDTQRDEDCGVTIIDYVELCQAAFAETL